MSIFPPFIPVQLTLTSPEALALFHPALTTHQLRESHYAPQAAIQPPFESAPALPCITISPPLEQFQLGHSMMDERRRVRNYHARRVRDVRKWVDASIQERMRSLEEQNEQLREALRYLQAELRRVQQQTLHGIGAAHSGTAAAEPIQ